MHIAGWVGANETEFYGEYPWIESRSGNCQPQFFLAGAVLVPWNMT
jgi:hypothetical protein